MAIAVLLITDTDIEEGAISIRCRYDLAMTSTTIDEASPAHNLAQKIMKAMNDSQEVQNVTYSKTSTTLQ